MSEIFLSGQRMGCSNQTSRSSKETPPPPNTYTKIANCAPYIFAECMFSNETNSRLQCDAKPTVFNMPSAPAKVGCKRTLVERYPIDNSQGSNA